MEDHLAVKLDYLSHYDAMCKNVREDVRKFLDDIEMLCEADSKQLVMCLPIVIECIAEVLCLASNAETAAQALARVHARIKCPPVTEIAELLE